MDPTGLREKLNYNEVYDMISSIQKFTQTKPITFPYKNCDKLQAEQYTEFNKIINSVKEGLLHRPEIYRDKKLFKMVVNIPQLEDSGESRKNFTYYLNDLTKTINDREWLGTLAGVKGTMKKNMVETLTNEYIRQDKFGEHYSKLADNALACSVSLLTGSPWPALGYTVADGTLEVAGGDNGGIGKSSLNFMLGFVVNSFITNAKNDPNNQEVNPDINME